MQVRTQLAVVAVIAAGWSAGNASSVRAVMAETGGSERMDMTALENAVARNGDDVLAARALSARYLERGTAGLSPPGYLEPYWGHFDRAPYPPTAGCSGGAPTSQRARRRGPHVEGRGAAEETRQPPTQSPRTRRAASRRRGGTSPGFRPGCRRRG